MSVLVILIHNEMTVFTDPLFHVQILKYQETDVSTTTLSAEEYQNNAMYLYALNESLNYEHVIIIKPHSMTLLSPSDMAKYVKEILKHNVTCFLSSWQNECQKFKSINPYLKYGSSSSDQAILWNAAGRKHMIKELEKKQYPLSVLLKRMPACVFVPNLIHFDINKATHNDDFLKLNFSLPIKSLSVTTENTTAPWIIVLILIMVFLVILVPWFKNHNKIE